MGDILSHWFCYEYSVLNVVKHRGITTDPQRRANEHATRWPGGVLQVVWGPVTETQARAWEATQTKTITP